MYNYDDFNCLIGKKLIEPSILSEDKTIITLKTETSTIKLEAEGDCCSHSWVEHSDIIPAGEIIKEVIEKDVTVIQEEGYDRESNSYNECIKQYFYEVKTDKGSYTIEMRNESNGYYGGCFNVKETENE